MSCALKGEQPFPTPPLVVSPKIQMLRVVASAEIGSDAGDRSVEIEFVNALPFPADSKIKISGLPVTAASPTLAVMEGLDQSTQGTVASSDFLIPVGDSEISKGTYFRFKVGSLAKVANITLPVAITIDILDSEDVSLMSEVTHWHIKHAEPIGKSILLLTTFRGGNSRLPPRNEQTNGWSNDRSQIRNYSFLP